ncbi:MAG: hypothetical protein C0498_10725 [Anaerolinea sp.]|jgi:ribosome-binding protein aMBF1 (putative translation factor)|nr:hypothetical protein [Anaerolinea sp.]
MTGITLRVGRVRARLRQLDLATRMGCSRSRVSQLEAMQRVPAAWSARYLEAVARKVPNKPPMMDGGDAKAVSDSNSETAREAGRGATEPLS